MAAIWSQLRLQTGAIRGGWSVREECQNKARIGGKDMASRWNRDFLTRRIDRCYRVASWTRIAEKRDRYIALARHYREVLAFMPAAAALA